MEVDDVIQLHLSNGKIFVWNTRDVSLLRETHHIVGSLIGSLPRAPRQNIQLGLPLELMPEEAYALIQYGAAVLCRLSPSSVAREDVISFQEARSLSFEQQKRTYVREALAKEREFKGCRPLQVSRKRRREERRKMRDADGESRPPPLSDEEVSGGDGSRRETMECEKHPETGSTTDAEGGVTRAATDSPPGLSSPASTSSTDVRDEDAIVVAGDRFLDKDVVPSPIPGNANSERDGISNGFPGERNDGEGGTGGRLDRGTVGPGRHPGTGVREWRRTEQDGTSVTQEPNRDRSSVDPTDPVSEGALRERVSGSGRKTKHSVIETDNPEGSFVSAGGVGGATGDQGTKEPACQRSQENGRDIHITEEEENGEDGPNNCIETPSAGVQSFNSTGGGSGEGERVTMTDTNQLTVRDEGCLVQLFTETMNPIMEEIADWSFPSTPEERLRAAVFLHFWKQGYYLTSGLKFGGDFLVYRGDPLLFHSTFVAICVPYERSMSTHTLVTYGRLGPIVKKTVVLCSLDDDEEVKCVSLQWSGF